MTDCQNMEKMNQNNFDDFEELAKNQSLEFSKSGCYQAFGGEFNEDVAAQMAEQQGLEFEAFEPINEAFEAELESNEKELEDEQRFVIQVCICIPILSNTLLLLLMFPKKYPYLFKIIISFKKS